LGAIGTVDTGKQSMVAMKSALLWLLSRFVGMGCKQA